MICLPCSLHISCSLSYCRGQGGLLALLQKVAAAIEWACVARAQPTSNGKRPSLISFMEAPHRKRSEFGLDLNKYETWQAERLVYLP